MAKESSDLDGKRSVTQLSAWVAPRSPLSAEEWEALLLRTPDDVRLMGAWAKAAGAFSDALKTLAQRISTVPKEEYDRLRAEVERARLASENARMMLELHRKEHGC